MTPEFDKISFNQYQIDADTGHVEPPVPQAGTQPPGRDGLYLLALRGYPTASWVGDLNRRNVRLIEALPPNEYLVRAEKTKIDTIRAEAAYIRGVFPLMPGMKIAQPSYPESPTTPHRVAITAVEETPEESLASYLDSISEQPVVLEDRLPGGRTIYVASLTRLDAEALTRIGHVYSVAGIAEPQPSAERQGMLALAPVLVGGRLELPSQLTSTQHYWHLLYQKGITDFNLTKVAMLDTGFDDGTSTHPDFQMGGVPTVTDLLSEFGTDYADNRDGHGTMVASIISAFTTFNQRADAEKYRYSLGLAPGVRLISDKFFSCSTSGDFSTALTRISNAAPNVVNLSWNQRFAGSCGYTSLSDTVDRRTRQHHWLFTMSAGNSFDDATCTTVRGPATARNGLTVGATESFTPSAYLNVGGLRACDWNNQPAVRDARNIPTFSLLRQLKSTVKPDLVAPGVRVTGPLTRASRCASIFCNLNVETVGA